MRLQLQMVYSREWPFTVTQLYTAPDCCKQLKCRAADTSILLCRQQSVKSLCTMCAECLHTMPCCTACCVLLERALQIWADPFTGLWWICAEWQKCTGQMGQPITVRGLKLVLRLSCYLS